MTPSILLSAAAAGLWTKCFSVYSCPVASRGISFLPNSSCVKWLSTTASTPPKIPLNSYVRFLVQQNPAIVRRHPEIKRIDVVRIIAQQWRTLSPEQKRPFEEATVKDMAQYKVDLERYMAQLSPAQKEQQALDKKQRRIKSRAHRKKRELTTLGKPKRFRTAFNIYLAEHYHEAKGSIQEVMKSMQQNWRNLLSHQKQVYRQLAEDDKFRYKTEMKSWEERMVDLGRTDLIRVQTLSTKVKKTAPKAKNNVAKSAKNCD